jgi:para-nitrobenzyl esterase
MSVATLLTMPRAKGLFHRAIVRSGNTPNVNSAATAQRIGRRLADLLGVEATREAIAGTSTARVLQAQAKLRDDLLARPRPGVLGQGGAELSFLGAHGRRANDPETSHQRHRCGRAADINLLVGSNTEETRLFFVSDGSIDRITYEALLAMAAAYGLPAEGLSGYRAAHPGANAGELLSAIQTDWYWRIPAVRLADAHASTARASTYKYEFAWRSPQFGGRLGAARSMEIPLPRAIAAGPNTIAPGGQRCTSTRRRKSRKILSLRKSPCARARASHTGPANDS